MFCCYDMENVVQLSYAVHNASGLYFNVVWLIALVIVQGCSNGEHELWYTFKRHEIDTGAGSRRNQMCI